MTRRRSQLCLFAALSVVVVAGCATHEVEREPTIATLEGRKVEVDKTVAIEAPREKAAAGYRAYLRDAPRGEREAEALRRLGDLSMESSEEALYNSEAASEADYSEAIKLYEKLLEAYPRRQGNDRVLYQLARAYDQERRPKEAMTALDRLIDEYPDSPFIAEAHFRRGEHLFVDERYAAAERAYQAVLKLGTDSGFYDRALYKHGWTLFKQLRYREGLDDFVGLLDRLLSGVETSMETVDREALSRTEKELLNDTLRVVTLSFVYLGGVEYTRKYFDANGSRPYESLIYGYLGDHLITKERFVDATKAYRAFIEEHPTHREAPLFQVRVIEAYRRAKFPTRVLNAKRTFVEEYGMGTTYWKRHTRSEMPEVVAQLKTHTRDLARHYHGIAQDSGEPTDYAEAARWYRVYLRSFPDDELAPRMHFLLAEALYESEAYRDAALAYQSAAYDYGEHADAAEAGYAALLAFDEYAKGLEREAKATWHRRRINSAVRFARAFPDHDKAPAVLADAAEQLFERDELERAIEASKGVLGFDPPAAPALRRTAATVLAHSQFQREQYGGAEGAYRTALELTSPDEELRGELEERLAASIYQQGEQNRAKGKLAEAVDHFRRVGTAVPNASIRSTAMYDAAAVLIEMKRWKEAIEALEAFRERYPGHELNAEVTRKLAVANLEAGRKVAAADEFQRIATGDAEHGVRREAIWQAAELYEEAERPYRAARAYRLYVEQFPNPLEQAVEARQHIASLYKSVGETDRYHHWLREIVRADRFGGESRTDRTRYLAAQSAMILAEPAYRAYRQVRLVEPLKQNLKRKKRRMETAIDAFSRVADYGIAKFATEATYRVAEIYRDFSKALLESDPPSDLSGEALAQYKILLEEQAFPFEEKAIEIHEINAGRVAEDNIYDKWVRRSFDALARLMPARYAKVEKSETAVKSIR